MAPFSRRPARRGRAASLALHRHGTSKNGHQASAPSPTTAASSALRKYGTLTTLALAAVFLLAGEDSLLTPLSGITGIKSRSNRALRRNLRVMDATDPEENLALPGDLGYDPTNPLSASSGGRNLKAESNDKSKQQETKGWSVGDVFSRSSAGDYNDDGSGSDKHRSLSSESNNDDSAASWFAGFGSGKNKYGGLGPDLPSIQAALDSVVPPKRRFLANWDYAGNKYLYEWTDGTTREPVPGPYEDNSAEALITIGKDGGEEDNRPVMHTFFEAITSRGLEDELALVAAWEASWQAAGWRTKVLTGEDAKRHFQYDELWPLIDAMPLIQYDKLCYLRWMAMGATGGGWMSDYDTLPLRGAMESAVDLSQRPTFTIYGQNLAGDAVPALLSGSASEWNRMLNALIRLGPTAVETVGKFPFPSDMYSLMSLQYSDEVYFHVVNGLMRGQDAMFSLVDGPSDFDCSKFNHLEVFEGERVPDWRAIHFSHAALMDVNVGFNNIASYRPKFALRWTSLYRHKCLGEPMPGTQEEGGDPIPLVDPTAEVESEVETTSEVIAQEEEANSPETVETLEAMEEIEKSITSQFEDAKAELETQMKYADAAAKEESDAKADAEYEAFYSDQGKPARILEVQEEEMTEGEAASTMPDSGRFLSATETAVEEPVAAPQGFQSLLEKAMAPSSPVPESSRALTATDAASAVEDAEPSAATSVDSVEAPEGSMAPGSILERALAPEMPAVPAPELPSEASGEVGLAPEIPSELAGSILERALAPEVPAVPAPEIPALAVEEPAAPAAPAIPSELSGSILERALAPEIPAVPAPEIPAAPATPAAATAPAGAIPAGSILERALAPETPAAPATDESAGNGDYLTPPVPSMPVP